MSDLTARAIADLKAELTEAKAAANRVTESMGSEILRLQGELAARNEQVEALQSWQDGIIIACGSLGLQPSEVAAHIENLRSDRDATHDELEQQRTRAKRVEQELAELRIQIGQHPATKAWAESSIAAITALRAKLAAIRAHLASWDSMALDNWARGAAKDSLIFHLLAAAREALEP